MVTPGSEDGDDSYIDRLHHLDIRQNGLQVEIIRDRPVGESLATVVMEGSQMGTAPSPIQPGRPSFVPSDPKAFLAEFQKEAGSLRPNG
jgi:hypothetical protein